MTRNFRDDHTCEYSTQPAVIHRQIYPQYQMWLVYTLKSQVNKTQLVINTCQHITQNKQKTNNVFCWVL